LIPDYKALEASILTKQAKIAGRSNQGEELFLKVISIQIELANRHADMAIYSVGLIKSLRRLSELQESLGKAEKAKATKELANREIARIKKESKLLRPFYPFLETPRDPPFWLDKRNKDPKG